MEGEKRKDHRQSLKYPARIDCGDGTPPVSCLLVDVSESGARVIVENVDELPETFMLLLAGETGRQRRCQVVWQDGKNFGISFVKTPVAKADKAPGFRELMRRD